MNCLQRGQVGILLTYLLLFGLRCVLTGKNRWSALAGGIVLALPISIKIIPALPVGVLCLLLLAVAGLHRWNQLATRRALGMCAGVVAGLLLYILVIPSAIIGPAANAKHLSTWLTVMADKQGQSDDDFSVHTKRNQSFMNGLYRLGNWTAYKYGHAPDDRIIDADSDDTPPQNVPMLMDSYWQSLAVRLVQLGLLAILFAAGWTARARKQLLDNRRSLRAGLPIDFHGFTSVPRALLRAVAPGCLDCAALPVAAWPGAWP